MHFPRSDDKEFSWIGVGRFVNVRRRRGFTVEENFREFEHGDLRVTVGDHVLIRNDDAAFPEDIRTCYVARVDALYRRSSDKEEEDDDCNRAVVQWYSRIEEACRPAHLSSIKHLPKSSLAELVLEKRDYEKDVDAETIFDKCKIFETDALMADTELSKLINGLPCFVVRFEFNGKGLKLIGSGASHYKRGRPSTRSEPNCTELRTPKKTATIQAETRGTGSASKKEKDEKSSSSPFSNFYSPRRSQSTGAVSSVRRLILESPVKVKETVAEIDEPVSRNSAVPARAVKKGRPKKKEIVTMMSSRLQDMLRSAKKKLLQDADDENGTNVKFMQTRSGRKVTWRKLSNSISSDSSSSSSATDGDSDASVTHDDISSSDSEVFKVGDADQSDTKRRARKRSSTNCQGAVKSKTPKRKEAPVARIPTRHQSCPLPLTHSDSVLERVRASLHVSFVPDTLPCRAKEFTEIYAFVEGKFIDGTGGCMYISGVPGTGKTATVLEVIRSLKQAVDTGEIPSFTFVDINGMKLTDPRQAYVQIYKHLTGQKVTAAHAVQLLEKRFRKSGPRRETVVLLVDELDMLWTRRQDVMYSLFDWPGRPHSRLVILAIANTMDLPERVLMNRVSSRMGLTRITFHPYSYMQLQEILEARLGNFIVFDRDALQLVARKVAAMSGDARRALDICRRATELTVDASVMVSPRKRQGVIVGMGEVDCAIKEMFSSPKVEAIRYASVQEQVFLQAVVAEFQRVGLEEAPFVKIYKQHVDLCRIQGFEIPNPSQASSICARLSSCRLLLLEKTANDLNQRIRLNVSTDDVNFALKLS